MSDAYGIMLGDQCIGMAEVKREGLYYCFRCQCRLSGEIIYQLKAVCGEKECNLGVCVPVEKGFGINTRLPIKKVGEGKLSFYVTPRHSDITDKFVPIRADEPFVYLEKLQNAHLDIRNGVIGIAITEAV